MNDTAANIIRHIKDAIGALEAHLSCQSGSSPDANLPDRATPRSDVFARSPATLPCPFCGSSNVAIKRIEAESWSVDCKQCTANGPWGNECKCEAVRRWNMRVNSLTKDQQ